MHLSSFVWWTFCLFIGTMSTTCRRADVVPPTPVEPLSPADPPASLLSPIQPQPPAPTQDATVVSEAASVKDPIETIAVPTNPIAKAQLYFEMGYGAAAFQILSTLPPEERQKPENQLLEGLSAEMCGRFKEAATACAAAESVSDETRKLDALLCQGRVWMQLKDFKFALQKFQTAYQAAPHNLATTLALMDALVTLNDGPGLLRLTKKVLESDPNHYAAQLYLGIAFEMTGQREDADAMFGKLTDNDAIPAYLEATAMDRRGLLWAKIQPERARSILEQCRIRLPSYGCPHTEVAISPPDPRHPNRKIRNVNRPGRYGTAPLVSPPP